MKPTIGISSCLLGQNVRFDGGHKKHRLITDVLAKHIDLKAICPEIEMGLPVPRPAIRLQDLNNQIELVDSKNSQINHTEQMLDYSRTKIDKLAHLDGYIFKKGSPSCGAFRVPVVVHHEGHRRHDGVGIFADQFMKKYPWIPVEEEGRLNDAALKENFLERVFALHRWHQIEDPDNNMQALIQFHASHKLMLMARNQPEYRRLGRFVAETTQQTLKERRHEYINDFMSAMSKHTSRGQHINVLMHIMGYFKDVLSHHDKHELLNHFESYRKNLIPLTALLLLLHHYLRKYPDNYLEQQYYLDPYPKEIAI